MNRNILSIIIAAVVLLIIVMMVIDYSGDRADKRGNNPYEYNVDRYKSVDTSLVHYRESKQIPLGEYKAGGLDLFGGNAWLAGEGFLLSLDEKGRVTLNQDINGEATCLEVTPGAVYIAFEDHIKKYSHGGVLEATWDREDERTVFTSLAAGGETIYAADAGNRRVVMYDTAGSRLGTFEGKAENSAIGHGFVVPSASFDLVINRYDELWVVNPGLHAVENYNKDGDMRGYWQKSSMNVEGFSGCCNPAEIDVMADGSFVTSEKGLVRIKIYDQSGKLLSVVAPPGKFNEEGKAPEVKVDDMDRIWALDFDRSMIRIFEHIQ